MNKAIVNKRVSTRVPHIRDARHHKFRIGEAVRLVRGAGDLRSKELEQEMANAAFEITRLLPQDGPSFQYRIKDAITGRERVVAEEQIAAAS
jgi:hypothetical protein